MNNNISGVLEEDCCGCGACFQICPKKSITMEENKRGFFLPHVNKDVCVQCGLCVKVCPERNSILGHPVKEAYAAVSNDTGTLRKSTSGGVFGELSRLILNRNGVVFGCGWKDNIVQHVCIEQIEDIGIIQQSKYLQSDTATSFIDAKTYLNSGKLVLYSGTACQLAGLVKFLGKEYDNLITVEVACHGVPSPGLFRKYCDWLIKNNNSRINKFQFRSKNFHKKGEHYRFSVEFANGKKKSYLSWEDPYYGSFLQGRTLRDTCYHCKYKNNERISDLLLADFWGIEKEHPDFPAQYGASAVMVMTEKGKKILESVSEHLLIQNSSFERIVMHNKSIIDTVQVPQNQKLIDINIPEEQLFRELKPAFSIKRRIRNMIPEQLKYIIKRL